MKNSALTEESQGKKKRKFGKKDIQKDLDNNERIVPKRHEISSDKGS